MTTLTPDTGHAAAKAISITYAHRVVDCYTSDGGVTAVAVQKRNGKVERFYTLEGLARAFPKLWFGV